MTPQEAEKAYKDALARGAPASETRELADQWRLVTRECYMSAMQEATRAGHGAADRVMRHLCQTDLFYLLVYVLNRPDTDTWWGFVRCREVQEDPDNRLDLWARFHWKSSIVTFGLSIFDILNNPDVTIGIFSFNRPIAKAFLAQIKRELESNELLKSLFPDILWDKPSTEAPKWSENEGLIVKRKSNPKECTVEAYGLTDGQPTSRHYQVRVYDDVVVEDSVRTPEGIAKTTKGWELSQALTTMDKEGNDTGRVRYVGTRYHFEDTYQVLLDRRVATPRIYPAEDKEGPVFMSQEGLDNIRRSMGSTTYAAQMLLNPLASDDIHFNKEDIRLWPAKHYKNLNLYLLVDPASSKKKRRDQTSMWVVGYGADGNFYFIDGCLRKLSLTEKYNTMCDFVKDYPHLKVYYEKVGMQSDIEAYREFMDRDNFRFPIIEIIQNKIPKEERIQNFAAMCEAGRVYFPERLSRKNDDGVYEDLAKKFIELYGMYPYVAHDDALDNAANITCIKMRPPRERDTETLEFAVSDFDPFATGMEG